MSAVDLTKPPSPRPFRVTDVEALGRSFIPLSIVAGVIHNDLVSLGEAFASCDSEVIRRCIGWSEANRSSTYQKA